MKKFTVTVRTDISVTDEDITDLIITALEGGIGYWACLDNSGPEFENAAADECVSETSAKIILNNGSLSLIDEEDYDTLYVLTLDKLLDGIRQYVEKGYDRNEVFTGDSVDMGMCDSVCADSIVQLALFDDIVYG